ncbi:MAG: hypothetical protein II891_07355 [Bacteroidales bacterium]|nr:hypothetical protein [Bacteroidales bacterium]
MKKLFYAIVTACALFAVASCGKDKTDESLDGRWDVYTPLHSGPEDCQTFTFIFDGNKVDAYIIYWAQRLKGTYTYADNKFDFKFDINEAWLAAVDDDYQETIDENVFPYVNPETLKTEAGYIWKAMSLQQFSEAVEMLKGWEFERESSKSGKGSDGHQSLTFVKK